jgi:hypothetical protein
MHHAVIVYGKTAGAAPRIRNLDNRWRCGHLQSQAVLTRGEEKLVLTEQKPGGSDITSGRFGKDKSLLPLSGIEPNTLVGSPVIIPSEQTRDPLCYL